MIRYGRPISTLIAILFPIIIYLFYTIHNSVNLFYADDYHLLKTVLWIREVEGVLATIQILISQHNEHRILVPRLLTILDYQIEGQINWKSLILIGNLIWIGNLWFFWEGFRHFKIPYWMFVAIPFIFLQPQYSDNVTWAISILQQSVIVFLYSLLTYLCSKNKYYWALLVAVLATFTHGNGIFSFIIGIAIALMDQKRRTALIWFLTWLVIGFIYFWHFVKGQNADFGRSFSDPARLIMSFFAFFGSMTKVRFDSGYAAVVWGMIMVFILGFYLVPKLKMYILTAGYRLTSFDKMLFGNVLFLGITAGLVSISRSWGGIEAMLAARYQHYSPYLLCWVYIVILVSLNLRNRKIAAVSFICFAILFNGLSYFRYNMDVQYHKSWLLADESNWKNHNVMLNYVTSINHNIKDTYQQVVAAGICKSESNFKPVGAFDSLLVSGHNLVFSNQLYASNAATGVDQLNYQIVTNDMLTGSTFLYLSTDDGVGYWLPTRREHSGIREFFRTGKFSKPGFKADFLTENFPSGVYRVGLLNNDVFNWTSKTISIP